MVMIPGTVPPNINASQESTGKRVKGPLFISRTRKEEAIPTVHIRAEMALFCDRTAVPATNNSPVIRKKTSCSLLFLSMGSSS